MLDGLKKALGNPYDAKTNVNGILNLGTAENHLMFPELLEKLNSDAIRKVSPSMLTYGTMYGSDHLRGNLARLFNTYLKPAKDVTADNITVHAGCGATLSNVAQALTNPGEGILIPCPFYGGFEFDLTMYAQAKLIHVQTKSTDEFLVTVDALETAFKIAEDEGTHVSALLLTNPGNPLGRALSPSTLLPLLQWAKRRNLHVISDEIYALSTFSESNPFVSVLSMPDLPDPDHTHVVWSFSKDFGSNGIRVGVFVSRNEPLLKAMHMFAVVTNASSLADGATANLLDDQKWVAWYVKENHKRMRSQCERITVELRGMEIPFLQPDSAFFLFMDLSRYAKKIEAAHEGPAGEAWRTLWYKLLDAGVYILPGEAFSCSEPGWYRIVFTVPWERISLGLERLKKVLASI
ncbi:pyridoxal phosphate-dependent transferase [Powellomyces hirtus]|nr:pyridoxal phosphate-dependent transferase [Powellomyces hirtus]